MSSAIRIAPSLLAADLGRLRDTAQLLEKAGADWLHVDIMDGNFAPNLSFGPGTVRALRDATSLPLDCHLMVSRPFDWIEPVIEAGADRVTIHVESTPHVHRALERIRSLGAAPGISLNPGRGVHAVAGFLDWVGTVQVMSVDPGFSGQPFVQASLRLVVALRALRGTRDFLIEIDGGIDGKRGNEARKAGADVFVVGSSLFREADLALGLRKLRIAIEGDSELPAPAPAPVERLRPRRVAIAADHAGFDLKQRLALFLRDQGFTTTDLGAHGREPSDYPDYAEKIGEAVRSGRADRGILICGSGVGAAVAVCKIPGIRGSVCHDAYSAHQGVEHDDMNVLVLGARVVGEPLAEDLVSAFLHARFSGESRHRRRLAKIEKLERREWRAA